MYLSATHVATSGNNKQLARSKSRMQLRSPRAPPRPWTTPLLDSAARWNSCLSCSPPSFLHIIRLSLSRWTRHRRYKFRLQLQSFQQKERVRRTVNPVLKKRRKNVTACRILLLQKKVPYWLWTVRFRLKRDRSSRVKNDPSFSVFPPSRSGGPVRVSLKFLFRSFWFLLVLMSLPFLVQWNMRGFRANHHWLRTSPSLCGKILCLQETFLDQAATVTFPGYVIYRQDRTYARGGGLVTMVASSLSSARVSLPRCPISDFEFLGTEVSLAHIRLLLINIYSPSGSIPHDWLTDIITSSSIPVIILGDFNINLLALSPPLSIAASSLLDWLLLHNLVLLNTTFPTRSGPVGPPSLLDLSLFSQDIACMVKFYVHPDPFDSDHQPIIFFLDSSPQSAPWFCRSVLGLAAARTMNTLPPGSFSSYSGFLGLCSRLARPCSRPTRLRYRQGCPWWDTSCAVLLSEKRRLLRRARSSCTRPDWICYKRASAALRRHLKSVSRAYWDSFCITASSTGKIYHILKRHLGRDQLPDENILRSSIPLHNFDDQAQAFLNFYSRPDPPRPLPLDFSLTTSDLDGPFTLHEMLSAISCTPPTAPGLDGITSTFLKSLTHHHHQDLLRMYNHILHSGLIPRTWRSSVILPIRKPGKPSSRVDSYRPIALTPVCCKIFERMILRRLLPWAGKRQLFPPEFFGFLPTRDVSTALCTFLQDILQARSQKWFVAGINLDIKAAYDSVDPELLTSKLLRVGIGGKLGYCVANLIRFRIIQVFWRVLSPSGPCFFGVPQGSVLSPFLFLVYLLDIVEILENGLYLVIYADDILLYVSDPDEMRARRKLQAGLDRIQQWCSMHNFSLSPEKCCAVNFSRCRDSGPSVKVGGCEIPWSPHMKTLGIWVSRSLSFRYHFQFLKTKLARKLNSLKLIAHRFTGVTSSHLLKISNATIRSTLDFGAPLFFDSPPSSLTILETCYNSALRLSTGLPRWTPLPVLHREAAVPFITLRLQYLTRQFLLRILAAAPGLRFGDVVKQQLLQPSPDWKWAGPLQTCVNIAGPSIRHLISFQWPTVGDDHLLRIVTDSFPFQDTTLADSVINQHWLAWYNSLGPCHLLATDASKDSSKTAIAFFDVTSNFGSASLTFHHNSVFTAEAMAILLALFSIRPLHPHLIFLTDSRSVLLALRHWSLHSPRVILLLRHYLGIHLSHGRPITLVWVPGHKGIWPNERADSLARQGPYSCNSFNKLAPEDLRRHILRDYQIETDYQWYNSTYSGSFTHLHDHRNHTSWILDRAEDVLIARWRSQTIITHSHLYRFGESFSPLCRHCWDRESPQHILLHCPHYASERASLLRALDLPSSASYSDIMSASCSSRTNLRHLLQFSRLVLPARFQ